MQGFYDPAPGVPKRLRMRYLFRGREHYGEVSDERPVVLPLQGVFLLLPSTER
jgi:DnaJ homolog subfamily C member 11